jgi:hypothetical protein
LWDAAPSWKVVGISCDAISSDMKLHDCSLTFKMNVAPRKRARGRLAGAFFEGGL